MMVVDVTEKVRSQTSWSKNDTFGVAYFSLLSISMMYKFEDIEDYVGGIKDCNT